MTTRRISIILAATMGILLALLASVYLWLDTNAGRAFVARKIATYQLENGLSIRIGRIDGSIYGMAILSDVRLYDMKGNFATIPKAKLDWHPFGYFTGFLDIDAITATEMRISRIPAFKVVPDTGEPLLPDIDITIDQLKIDRILFAKSIAGKEQIASLQGNVRIADRRALINATASSLRGDKLFLKLDAVPDDDRFDLHLSLDAPKGGLISGLAGRNVPIRARLDGKGSWEKWNGRLNASTGEDILADISLMARKGRFTAQGTMQPQLLLGDGLLARALAPLTRIDLAATFEDRVAKVEGSLQSSALELQADGVVDMGAGSFEDLVLDFRLLKPSVLARNFSGEGVDGKILLNGAFAQPIMAYSITANRLSFDETTFEGVFASGEAQGKSDRFLVPVNARARRVTGINAIAGGLLTNVSVNGDLAIADGRLLSDNLKIRSDRINATAIVIGDINKGFYTGALNGRVDNFRVESVGLFNVETDVDLETQLGSGYALVGTVKARSTRLFSPGFQNFLGGQMFVNAGIRYATDGVLRITRASVVAPQFRLNQGQGTYQTQGGKVLFNGSGFSTRYGPVAVQVTGTFDRPIARVTAARPGFGVGLSDIVAVVTRNGNGYGIALTGVTDYGPVSGDLDILSSNGPLTIDILRGDFAGIALTGRIRQASSGPFVGMLTGQGAGFDGTIALMAQGRYQRAVIDAVASNARLSGVQTLSIGRAIIKADVIIYERPQILADVQVQNALMGEVSIAAARAKIDYRAGNGTAKLLAEGRSVVPFRIAANAELTPRLWRIAASGRANSIDFSTVSPVRIIPGRNDYEIMLATIKVADGTVKLAGSYGAGFELQSRLDRVDLAILNPFFPGLGLGGRATGSLDWSQSSFAAFPRADTRLEITRFTRTSLGSRSQPVEISVVGRLLPGGGNARAIIRRRGVPVGRIQVD
ncbi:MAG: hypothetical protein WBO17_09005, partial [Sphingorhabdus sp.]